MIEVRDAIERIIPSAPQDSKEILVRAVLGEIGNEDAEPIHDVVFSELWKDEVYISPIAESMEHTGKSLQVNFAPSFEKLLSAVRYGLEEFELPNGVTAPCVGLELI